MSYNITKNKCHIVVNFRRKLTIFGLTIMGKGVSPIERRIPHEKIHSNNKND